jgi:hypothetical protein
MKICVLRPPTLHQDQGERVADPNCADRYQDAEDLGAEPGSSPATTRLLSRTTPESGSEWLPASAAWRSSLSKHRAQYRTQ